MTREERRGAAVAGLGAALAVLGACGERPAPGAGPAEVYRVYCARCHATDGRGDPRQVQNNPRLDLTTGELVRRGDRAGVRARIEDGHGPMPGFRDKLEPADLERLTEFVLRLRPAGGG